MSTVLDIINNAYRESNLVSAGQPATTAQVTEALYLLNNLVSSAYGYEVGGNQLVDWPIGNDNEQYSLIPSWTANDWVHLESNIRLVMNTTTAQTVRLPAQPLDGARVFLIDPLNVLAEAPLTIEGHTRAIEGAASVTEDIAGQMKSWFYRADLGNWVVLTAMTDTSADFPFPQTFDDYFITMLSGRINPRYGRNLDPESQVALIRSLEQLRARYHQKTRMPCDSGVLALSRGYGRWRSYGWPERISRGRARWLV